MLNPFRTEASAFRFLVGTIVLFVAVVIAALAGGEWWGLGVFVVLAGAASWYFLRARRPERPVRAAPTRQDAVPERRILVVANETLGGAELRRELQRLVDLGPSEVLVVCPALSTAVERWVSDVDGARAAAQERLDTSLARLAEAGIPARGEVGADDPLQAIEDALRTFGANEILISTHPEGRSHWLERGVVEHARERFAVPITHVVVDTSRKT